MFCQKLSKYKWISEYKNMSICFMELKWQNEAIFSSSKTVSNKLSMFFKSTVNLILRKFNLRGRIGDYEWKRPNQVWVKIDRNNLTLGARKKILPELFQFLRKLINEEKKFLDEKYQFRVNIWKSVLSFGLLTGRDRQARPGGLDF